MSLCCHSVSLFCPPRTKTSIAGSYIQLYQYLVKKAKFTCYNLFMASGSSETFNLPFPQATDPVNVHGDIHDLVAMLEQVLPPLGVGYFQLNVKNTSGSQIIAGTPVYATGYAGKTTVAKALPSTVGPILGLLKDTTANNADGVVVVAGVLEGINTSSFTAGQVLYVGESGGLSSTQPATGGGAVGIVAVAAETGVVIVEAKGNGTWGALKAGLA